jgi:hypothetical protein
MAYPNFPLTMALQNYMPVLFSALGLFWVAQMIHRADPEAGRLAFTGVALVVVAGTLKASWKLTMSVAKVDVPLFSQSLFPLLAPGFTCIAWSLFVSRGAAGQGSGGAMVWLVPLLISAASLGIALILALTQPGRVWVFVLIGVSTVANVALALLLIQRARQQRNGLAAGLFALNLVITFALSGIAGMPNKTLEVHWVEQIISTVSNAGFAWAAWMVAHAQSFPRRRESNTLLDAGRPPARA